MSVSQKLFRRTGAAPPERSAQPRRPDRMGPGRGPAQGGSESVGKAHAVVAWTVGLKQTAAEPDHPLGIGYAALRRPIRRIDHAKGNMRQREQGRIPASTARARSRNRTRFVRRARATQWRSGRQKIFVARLPQTAPASDTRPDAAKVNPSTLSSLRLISRPP